MFNALSTNTSDVDLDTITTDTLPTRVASDGGIGITRTANITVPGGAWMETAVVTVGEGYGGPLTNLVEVTTEKGATGEQALQTCAQAYHLGAIASGGRWCRCACFGRTGVTAPA